MITLTTPCPGGISGNAFPFEYDPENCVFFDIETTGFRASFSSLYMIGVVYKAGGSWTCTQWMSEDPGEEYGLLRIFAAFLAPFKVLLHFNGNRFDLPYLREKYAVHALPCPFDDMVSADLYTDIRMLRNLLGMIRMNQKALEQFLGVRREDLFDGGKLIQVYREYRLQPNEQQRNVLLLHNREDLFGMLSLLSFYSYMPLLAPDLGSCDISAAVEQTGTEAVPGEKDFRETGALTLAVRLRSGVPVSLQRNGDFSSLSVREHSASIRVPLYSGRLRYYFRDYKNYYYLPAEDQAVHKSVARYVDPAYRVQATADTCYTCMEGLFLPQPPRGGFSPAFRRDRQDFICYFQLPAEWEEESFCRSYAALLLQEYI